MSHKPSFDKIRLFRDYEIDETGVALLWSWECPHCTMADVRVITHKEWADYSTRTVRLRVQYIYWENAVKGLSKHIKEKHAPV